MKPMNRLLSLSATLSLLLASMQTMATTIEYQLANLGGDSWRYDYTVFNDSLGVDMEEFTVYFALGDYQNLSLGVTPAGWNSTVVQPGSFMGINDGYFDSLSAGLGAGATAGTFSVFFDWVGGGSPGDQAFEVVDPVSFAVLESGNTMQAVSAIPVPAAMPLMLSGLLALFSLARRR